MRRWKPFKAVSTADDGSVWVIDKDNGIHKARDFNSPWEIVNARGVDVAAVNYDEAWIAGENGDLYSLYKDQTFKMSSYVGLTRVARCHNGDIFAVGNHGKLYYKRSFGLESLPGVEAFDIACKSNRVYHIGRSETLHVMDRDRLDWTRVQGVRAVRIG